MVVRTLNEAKIEYHNNGVAIANMIMRFGDDYPKLQHYQSYQRILIQIIERMQKLSISTGHEGAILTYDPITEGDINE